MKLKLNKDVCVKENYGYPSYQQNPLHKYKCD